MKLLNKNAYRYEYIESKNGLFDKYVDCAYLLTLENSKRKDEYMKQLKLYNPHSKIIIQYDKGFKNYKKKLYKQNTVCDINDSYYNIFVHAKNNNYKNIIIFEDDFFFDNLQKKDIDEIGAFITNNNFHIYNLGPGLNISIPYTFKHHYSLVSTCAHGVIYNITYIDFFIDIYNKGFDAMCDNIWNKLDILKFKYYKPICFQTFPITENIKNWPFSKLAIFFINILNLDKLHKPGFTLLNIFSYIVPFIILILYVWLVSYYYKYLDLI